MKKLIYLVIITLLIFVFSNKIYAYKSYKIGDVVTYNDIDFYVIKDSGSDSDLITLLKADPLTIDEINAYDDGIQLDAHFSPEVMTYNNIYGRISYYRSLSCGYKTISEWTNEGCTTDYNSSNIKIVVDSWKSNKLNSDDIKTVRLATIEEISNLGYDYKEICDTCGSGWAKTNDTPKWAYIPAYWTMSIYDDSNLYVYVISEKISQNAVNSNSYVRPIVELYKSALGDTKDYKDDIDTENNDINIIKTYEEYKKGDKVNYKGIDFYVINESDKYSNYITLLKDKPLLTDEVNAYGTGHINRYEKDSTGVALDSDGYGGIAFYSREKCISGITAGCTADYKRSDVKYVVDNWAKDILDLNDLADDNLGYKTRLITYDELIDLGLNNFWQGTDGFAELSEDFPKWIYEVPFYWTMSTYGDSRYEVWIANKGLKSSFVATADATVRPVINLKKEPTGYEIIDKENKTDSKIKVDNNGNKADSMVNVPNTAKKMSILFIMIGVIMLSISTIIFIKNKDRVLNKDR